MINNRYKIFSDASQRLFNSDDGLLVLAYLNETYVKATAVDKTPELTYYKLGQKELIQSLIHAIKDPEKLDEIKVYNNLSEDN